MVEARKTFKKIIDDKIRTNGALSELRSGDGFSIDSQFTGPIQPIVQTDRFDRMVHPGTKPHRKETKHRQVNNI